MAKNENLHKAKDAKKDEFYTQYEDIQNELNHYEQHFKGKTVLRNCDDPFESNLCKFFLRCSMRDQRYCYPWLRCSTWNNISC